MHIKSQFSIEIWLTFKFRLLGYAVKVIFR